VTGHDGGVTTEAIGITTASIQAALSVLYGEASLSQELLAT
jgi:hypothetical protein